MDLGPDRTLGQRAGGDEPDLWTAHLRHTVNFSAALDTALGLGGAALVEVGPGRTLSSLARRHPTCADHRPVVASMPHASDEMPGPAVLLAAAGALWQAGVPLDWAAIRAGERLRRVPLPTYPFERRRLRVDLPPEADVAADPASGGQSDDAPEDWPTETQAAVARAFQAVLGVDRIEGHRSFFDLGGDSMLAARVVAILRREVGSSVGVRWIFTAPTVAGLAGRIDDEQRAVRP